MIKLISPANPIKYITNSARMLSDKTTLNLEQRDLFDRELEYINDVIIHKKIGFLKTFEQKAQIYKEKVSSEGTEKYFLKINGKKILGEIEIKNEESAIFVSNLESYARRKYKGVGSKLLQIAVEKSLEHTKDVILNAQKLHFLQRNPVKFYEKHGFHLLKEQTDYDKTTYGTEMILIPIQHTRWMDKIKHAPILPSALHINFPSY